MNTMHSPYGFEPVEKCHTCPLRGAGFFCDLSPAALKALQAVKYTTTYPHGAVLFVEEEDPKGVFVLCRGRVKLSITSSEGKALITRIAAPGEVLGLNAAVSGKPYELTAETLEPCQVNFVRREDFLRFLGQHGEASLRAAQQLSSRYRAACEQIRSLGMSHSAAARLARFLLDGAAKGRDAKEAARVRMTLTHEQIGQMIGTSRETVTRALGEFKDQRVITQSGSTVVIQDRAALETLVGV